MTIDPARRSALLGIKLAALVRDHVGEAPIAASTLPGGAALTRLSEAWVLADVAPYRILGQALAWSRRQPNVSVLNVLVEGRTSAANAGLSERSESERDGAAATERGINTAGVIARRADAFVGDVRVWEVHDRTLVAATPEPLRPVPMVPSEMLALSGEIAAAGADPLCEWGVLVGEVEGLEVCRVTRSNETGEVVLQVGIGAHDREAFAMLHGDRPPLVALQGVVGAVAPHRVLNAAPHALNRIATERLLRASLINEPGIVGAARLMANDPPVPRPNVKDPVPCVATGVDPHGNLLTVVCSVGIDLDLVPFAADARIRHRGRLVVVVPERDAHGVTLDLLSLLREPAGLVTVPNPI
jgi:hypothetical protein